MSALICSDCAMWAANADDSGASEDWHAHAEASRYIVGEVTHDFSTHPCDSCGDHLAGVRLEAELNTDYESHDDLYCIVCGETSDYCQGHGEIGDPKGYAAIQANDGEQFA